MLEESQGAKHNEYIWPELPYAAWKETYATLHMWTQIVGKIELELNPVTNHWWETALLITPAGLTTYPIFYNYRCFTIEFNFQEHLLKIVTSDGNRKSMSLESLSVSEFYYEIMKLLSELKISVKINTQPQEVPNPIPFPENKTNHTYNRTQVRNFHRILLQADRLMKKFSASFVGKASPVHFFWGSFDLAVSRFSGRKAKNFIPTDAINKEAYSHEVQSFGFWPGSGNILEAAFYAYAAPEPQGYRTSKDIKPKAAFYNEATKGYILKYDDVRKADNPDQMVLDFFESTYEAGAHLAGWDRRNLERNFH
jgi:hypothetical protein